MNHPAPLVLLIAGGLYAGKLWRDDLRAWRAGASNPNALPGATGARANAIAIAVSGAVVLLVLETLGELQLGLWAQQSRMTWLAALYSIAAAPIIEELIFRGCLVVMNRGRAAMWGSAVAASALFALLHPFLWRWDEAGFAVTLTPKGAFSTGVMFATSLWFYGARLASWNPHRSLLPCFAAHAAKNAGVVAIKATGGFMGGLW